MEFISQAHYWMGRDKAYAKQCTLEIRRNALLLLAAANVLLAAAATDDILPMPAGVHGYVASGWRPPAVNDKTSHAAGLSAHLFGLAIDIRDWPDRRLARWCLRNLAQLERLGIYMEDPRWTPSWVHWQLRAPGSGKRVYIPSTAPALALALPEQQQGASA